MSKRSKQLFVVLHVEIMGGSSEIHMDDMVFHVASSLEKAEEYIKQARVEPYSWWEIIVLHEDDTTDEANYGHYKSVGFYGPRGGKLKAHPYNKAVAIYKKCLADPNHHLCELNTPLLAYRLFPNLPKGPWCHLDLSRETKVFVKTILETMGTSEVNPFLDTVLQDNFIKNLQEERGVKYSYGGYMEDRELFMKGQYQKPGEVIHRGIDYNVPVNTEVSVPVPGKLVQSYQDLDQNGGWGGKLVFEHLSKKMYFILGHLKDIATELDRVYQPGEIIGRVAESEVNGNWYPHLHLQCVRKEFPRLDINVDGYGAIYKGIKRDFPDPEMSLI